MRGRAQWIGGGAGRLGAALGLCLAAAGLGGAPEERREAGGDQSEEFFNRGPIPTLRIELDATNLARLRRHDREYVRATVIEGDTVYREVGLHLKGAAGSFRGLDDRPNFTLNFDKFRERQKFHGLDKIHLNNSVQDPSLMTEILCGELFRAAGVPAPRGTHARVWFNRRDLGLYVLKEGFDKTFLRRYFKNPHGNLYDGGFLKEITEPIERTSGQGDVPPHSELKALAAAAHEPNPARRLARLEQVLDLDRFLSFIALEVMTWHWDGYLMKKNNYRVYHDPESGKIVFFPHGMDQMFWEPNGPIYPQVEGLVARQLLEVPEGKRRYRQRLHELYTNVFRLEPLTNRIADLQARIRPALEAISADAARQHDGAVAHLRNQIVARARFLERAVGRPEAAPLAFDAGGLARLTGWQPVDTEAPSGELDTVVTPAGQRCLFILAGDEGRCIASWRARVLLPAGRYRFEARARTIGVVPLREEPKPGQPLKGEGAGIRISRAKETRPNKLLGTAPWQPLAYDFQVSQPSEEVELLCELRAAAGEAWFDLDSLRLKKH